MQPAGAIRAHTCLIGYRDPHEGFAGYLALDGHRHPLAAGGLRLQPGLTAQTVAELAQAMTRKQRLLDLGVDGAKCGIDYEPEASGKRDAIRRFLGFLRPYLVDRLSIGPDMGTSWDELEDIAREVEIPSVKIAVAKAQGLREADFWRRLRLLDTHVHGLSLGQRRAGHALAHAAVGAVDLLDGVDRRARVGVQGFGTLGRATALSLLEAGLSVTAVADEHACLVNDEGLDARALLAMPKGRVGDPSEAMLPSEALFGHPVEVLILSACEDAMSVEVAEALPPSVRLVVVGANLGLSDQVERILHEKGVVVVPDFVGGAGGSASMNALFGPTQQPSSTEFLQRLERLMREVTQRVLRVSADQGVMPREAALRLCDQERSTVRPRPYG